MSVENEAKQNKADLVREQAEASASSNKLAYNRNGIPFEAAQYFASSAFRSTVISTARPVRS